VSLYLFPEWNFLLIKIKNFPVVRLKKQFSAFKIIKSPANYISEWIVIQKTAQKYMI